MPTNVALSTNGESSRACHPERSEGARELFATADYLSRSQVACHSERSEESRSVPRPRIRMKQSKIPRFARNDTLGAV
jgi:hypothetical protein